MVQVTVAEVKMRRLDLPLPGGRVLHVALELDEHDEPTDLVLATSFDGHSGLRALAEGVCVPASALPALRDALAAVQR